MGLLDIFEKIPYYHTLFLRKTKHKNVFSQHIFLSGRYDLI